MSWILPVLLAWAVLSLPGYLMLCLVGARIPVRWGWAPPVTVVLLVVLSALLPLLRIPWGPVGVVLGLALLLVGALGVRVLAQILADLRGRRAGGRRMRAGRALRRPGPRPGPGSSRTAVIVTAVSVACGLLLVASAGRRMGGIDTLNGSYDAFFHLSAIAFIRDGGDAFPLTALTGIYHAPTFYPVAFDAMSALLPFGTVVSANAMMLSLLAALPSSVAALVATAMAGARRVPLLAALGAAASTVFLSIPAMALVMGLWPIVLGALCLPVAIAAVIGLLDTRRGSLGPRWIAGTAVVLTGTALAHPSVLFSVAVLTGLLVLVHGVIRLRDGQRRRGLLQIGGALLAAAGFVLVSGILLSGMHLTRHSSEGVGTVLWEVLVDSPRIPVLEAPWWPVAALWLLAAIGAAAALRRGEAVGLSAALGVVATIVLGISTQIEHPLPVALVNPWYGARERIAPLMMCLLVLLAMRAVVALADRGRRTGRPQAAVAAVVVVALTALAALVVPQRLPLTGSLAYTAYGLQLSPYVTGQEREFIEASAEDLPADAVVLADPLDGATLYWSIGGVETVYPTMSQPQSRDQNLIARYVTDLDERRQVCGALERIGPTHLYRDTSEFAGRLVSPEASATWSGVHDIPDSALTPVARDGPYALYELEPPC